MSAVDAFRTHSERARRAADRGSWRQAAREARAAFAAYPEPPGWLAQGWRKLRLGALLRDLEEGLGAWQARARAECLDEATAHKDALAWPDASAAAQQLDSLSEELEVFGGADEAAELRGLVADWRKRSCRYVELMNAASAAATALRHREANSTFEQACSLFATRAALEGMKSNAARVALEAAFEAQVSAAEQARFRRRLATARALLVQATQAFPREDGLAALSRVEGEGRALASLFDGVVAARDRAWARAERAFGAAVEAYGPDAPGALPARLFQVSMLLRRGHPDRALTLLEGLRGPVAASRRAIALVQLGRFLEGAAEFEACKLTDHATNARAHRARRLWRTLSTIERCVANGAWEEGEQEARLHLASEDDDTVRSALHETLEAARARSRWDQASPEARIRLTLADMQRAPSPQRLHQWFVALESLVDVDQSLTPSWAVACFAVLANLASSPAFASPHRTWTEADKEVVEAALRKRLEDRLDWARSSTSPVEAEWRALWHIEAAASSLAGPERRMPVRDGLQLTPGLWRQLGERLEEVPPAADGSLESEAFAALYGPCAAPVAAWLARDLEVTMRAPVPDALADPWRGHATLARGLQAVERGLETLEAEASWQGLLPHRELLRRHRPWCDRADKLAQATVDELTDEAKRVYVAGWYAAIGSAASRTWHVNVEVADLWEALSEENVAKQDALAKLEGLLRSDPRNAAAQRLRELVRDSMIAAELDGLMRAGDWPEAVDLAVARGSDDIRARTAEVLWGILTENHRGMDPDLVTWFVRSLYRLCPDDPNYRELYFRI
jgi:hypothetical protein